MYKTLKLVVRISKFFALLILELLTVIDILMIQQNYLQIFS